jgi:peptidoglycan/LPS O-acetylase OafA/YrhL
MLICGWAANNLFIVVSAVAALSMYAVCLRERLDGLFNSAPLQFVGKISYSLYLIHNPVAGASFFITSRQIGGEALADLASLGIAVAACIISSFLFWWAIERPSQLLGRRLLKN